jgi:two-component system, OmpR family, response regulator RegX3
VLSRALAATLRTHDSFVTACVRLHRSVDARGVGRHYAGVESVLVVEDDDRIRISLAMALEDEGYAVRTVSTGEAGLTEQRATPADTVLVDLMLPGIDGYQFIRDLRRFDESPVIVISARSDTHDVVAALEAGADDYVIKPVAVKELAARLRAMRRRLRSSMTPPQFQVIGDLEVRSQAGEVLLHGDPISLTRTEFRLLCELAEHVGLVLSRQQLLSRVWDYASGDERLVDVHIGRLRMKIEDNPAAPQRLVTVRGMGYKLQR